MGSFSDSLVHEFKSKFGGEAPAIVSFAPGRAEILGNHTDYNQGLVLSAAIDRGTYFLCRPRTDSRVTIVSHNMKSDTTFDLPKIEKTSGWSDYIRGILVQLTASGVAKTGFDAVVGSDVPLGAGLSSSAALEVAAMMAFTELYHLHGDAYSRLNLAKICQRSENEFVGLKCGLLDQFSSLFGKKDCLVRSDFRSLEVANVPLGPNAVFLIANTHVAHALVSGKYNDLADACARGAKFFASALPADRNVRALRDVTLEDWNALHAKMESVVAKRSKHIITENERVLKGEKLLASGHLVEFGKLMFDSHESSRVDFENSCPELDITVEEAKKLGALGARLSGGGFGGSAIVMLPTADVTRVSEQLRAAFKARTGRELTIEVIQASQGAHIVHGAHHH